jgi:hypothetical protein
VLPVLRAQRAQVWELVARLEPTVQQVQKARQVLKAPLAILVQQVQPGLPEVPARQEIVERQGLKVQLVYKALQEIQEQLAITGQQG